MAVADEQTIDDYVESVTEIRERFDWLSGLVDPEGTATRIAELDELMQTEGFWDEPEAAGKVSAERTRAQRKLDNFAALRTEVEDVETLLEMGRELEPGSAEAAEIMQDIQQASSTLADKLGQLQEDALFTGEFDAGPAVVSFQSGEGGVDAQDWTEMLMRMYVRFWEQRGYKVSQTSQTDGDQAGIRSASFLVEGDYAYGVMNAEAGVHRLVRLSPFDSANRRQTSFAQVEVSPYVGDQDIEVDIDESDLRVDTYRASGAGGQHVNKTDSAVRITHMPTGVVVQCQNERSQHQNRDTAMKMLKSQLFELERQKLEAQVAAERGEAQNVGFGSQIRSYVLHPYKMVKDLRTRHETGNVEAVLDGALDDFVRALLLQQAKLRDTRS